MIKRKTAVVALFLFVSVTCFCSYAFAQAPGGGKDVGVLVAKIIMGISLSLGLAGSAIGLAIAFSALLGGGQENFFKNIAVALMPSTQGIYSIVVLFANMDGFEADSYATAGKAAAFGFAMFFSAWYQGVKTGKFPPPIKLGPKTSAWRESDVNRLIQELAAK